VIQIYISNKNILFIFCVGFVFRFSSCVFILSHLCTGLFEMIVGVLTTCHLVLQMQPYVIYFYGVTWRIKFMFLVFPQVSRNRSYESEPPFQPSPLTC